MSSDYVTAAFSPDAVLGEVGGVPVVLEAVVLRASGVLIFLAARRNLVTAELDANYRSAFEAWAENARLVRERGGDPPHPPDQPGEMLAKLGLVVRDDIGTSYRWAGTSSAGTGTEWEATWRFQPAVPRQARRLTILINDADGRTHAESLPLLCRSGSAAVPLRHCPNGRGPGAGKPSTRVSGAVGHCQQPPRDERR